MSDEIDYKQMLDNALLEVKEVYRRLDGVQRENRGTQEMLALVLAEVGEPVILSKAEMKKGIAPGSQIAIQDDGDHFIFSLEQVNG